MTVAFAIWHVATHEVLASAALGLCVSMLDDCLIDIIYFVLLFLRRTRPSDLPNVGGNGGWMAIIVPAWDEADVIAPVLSGLVARLDYHHYHVFVGIYPNDPATRVAVESVIDPRISVVTCTRPGPTTKADCLNHLWRAAVEHESIGIM